MVLRSNHVNSIHVEVLANANLFRHFEDVSPVFLYTTITS